MPISSLDRALAKSAHRAALTRGQFTWISPRTGTSTHVVLDHSSADAPDGYVIVSRPDSKDVLVPIAKSWSAI